MYLYGLTIDFGKWITNKLLQIERFERSLLVISLTFHACRGCAKGVQGQPNRKCHGGLPTACTR